ncbi:hypothetical protein P154DRAFT_604267, partial [Amniculicola lignicola CBS 123094]
MVFFAGWEIEIGITSAKVSEVFMSAPKLDRLTTLPIASTSCLSTSLYTPCHMHSRAHHPRRLCHKPIVQPSRVSKPISYQHPQLSSSSYHTKNLSPSPRLHSHPLTPPLLNHRPPWPYPPPLLPSHTIPLPPPTPAPTKLDVSPHVIRVVIQDGRAVRVTCCPPPLDCSVVFVGWLGELVEYGDGGGGGVTGGGIGEVILGDGIVAGEEVEFERGECVVGEDGGVGGMQVGVDSGGKDEFH